jgi:hydrogenase expression/formation protein HypE
MNSFPLGKLPPEELNRLFAHLQKQDPRVLVGPGVGLDCAVIDFGETLIVAKSDPITFTAEDIGWYAVQVNANDIATTGAKPRWFLSTLLLPEADSNRELVDRIFFQIESACRELGITVVGGHTEITVGLDRPILSGTMLGEVPRDSLITPRGAHPGDAVLLTKGVPIEAGSILAREYGTSLAGLDKGLIQRARDYLREPGISIVKEAQIAAGIGGVTAMHDPTEGGILCGLWELADAAQVGLTVQLEAIPILPEAKKICELLNVDPFSAIASGALLLTVEKELVDKFLREMHKSGIQISLIGWVIDQPGVFGKEGIHPLPRPKRDSLSELFERRPPGKAEH